MRLINHKTMVSEKIRSIEKMSALDLQVDLFEKFGMEQKFKDLLGMGPKTAEQQAFLDGPFQKTAFFQNYGFDISKANFSRDGNLGSTTGANVAYFRYLHDLTPGDSVEEIASTQDYIVQQEKAMAQAQSQLKILGHHMREVLSMDMLRKSPFSQDQIAEFTEKAINPTLEISKKGYNELKPENYVLLEYSLQDILKDPAGNGLKGNPEDITVAEFDNCCTEARKEILRNQLINLTGDEFYEHTKKFTYASRREILGRKKEQVEPPNPSEYLAQYEVCYAQAAAKHNVPKDLLISVHYGESLFDHLAVSSGDCYGVGQSSSYAWAKEKDGVPTGYVNINPFKIPESIDRTAEHIKPCYLEFAGQPEPRRSELAMIAYSSNGPRVAKDMVKTGQDTGDIQYVRHIRQRRRELEQKLQATEQSEKIA